MWWYDMSVHAFSPSFSAGYDGVAGLGTTARIGLLSWGEPTRKTEKYYLLLFIIIIIMYLTKKKHIREFKLFHCNDYDWLNTI